MKNTLIQIPRSFRVELSPEVAVARLNEKQHLIGEPDFVPYYDENKKVNAILSIGIKNGNGNDSYKIVSARECNLVWDILDERPENPDPDKIYILNNSGIYSLLHGTIEEPLPKNTWFLNIQDESFYISNSSRSLRNISDFRTQEEIDSLIQEERDNYTISNFTERDPDSNTFILNKPEKFSQFTRDIEYTIRKTDIHTYRLRKNNEDIGDPIIIPENSYIISCEIVNTDLVFKIKTPETIETVTIDLSSLIPTKYKPGRGINVDNGVISINTEDNTGISIDENGELIVNEVSEDSPGAPSQEDDEIIREIKPWELIKRQDLIEGRIGVKTAEKVEGIKIPKKYIIGNREPFTFRSSGQNLDIETGTARIEIICGGDREPFNPKSLKSIGNNAANPSNVISSKQIGPAKQLLDDPNYNIVWFPVIKGDLGSSVFTPTNNGYSITPVGSLGNIGFTLDNPENSIKNITILQGQTTPYSANRNHYIPPESGWLLVSIKKEDTDKLCARLSWTGIKDDFYEPYIESEVLLKRPESNTWGAFGMKADNWGGEYFGDYWSRNEINNLLYFTQQYTRTLITEDSWGDFWSDYEYGFSINYYGEGDYDTVLINPGFKLPDEMYVDGLSVTPSYTYNFGDTNLHEVNFQYNKLTDLPSFMFSNIKTISSVSLQSNLKTIGASCFKDCSNLERVKIPASVIEIGDKAFYGVSDNLIFTCLPPLPPVQKGNTFSIIPKMRYGTKSTKYYLSDPGWSKYGYYETLDIEYHYMHDLGCNFVPELLYGLDNINSDGQCIYFDTTDPIEKPPTGYLYYNLENSIEYNTGVSSIYSVGNYGTEVFIQDNNISPTSVEIYYTPDLYASLENFRKDLDDTILPDNIETTINTSKVVQNKVIKEYIDSTVRYRLSEITDLSRQDIYGNKLNSTCTANSYVVRKPGVYKIPLVYGNAIKDGRINTPAFTNRGTQYCSDFMDFFGYPIETPYIKDSLRPDIIPQDLCTLTPLTIWKTSTIIDSNNLYIERGNPYSYLVFTVTGVNGNETIGLYLNAANSFVWSWNIWATQDDLSTVELNNGYQILPVNLGNYYDATGHPLSIHYQWGRKDPFPGSIEYGENTEIDSHHYNQFEHNQAASSFGDIIRKPYAFYLSANNGTWNPDTNMFLNYWNTSNTELYGSSDIRTVKSIYDPCPYGFKVPNAAVFRNITRDGSFNSGWNFKDINGNPAFFPTTGRRDPDTGNLEYSSGTVSEIGASWTSSTVSDSEPEKAYALSFDSSSVLPLDKYNKSYGLPIRPVKE